MMIEKFIMIGGDGDDNDGAFEGDDNDGNQDDVGNDGMLMSCMLNADRPFC